MNLHHELAPPGSTAAPGEATPAAGESVRHVLSPAAPGYRALQDRLHAEMVRDLLDDRDDDIGDELADREDR